MKLQIFPPVELCGVYLVFAIFCFYLDCFCFRFGVLLGFPFLFWNIKSYFVARGSQEPFSTFENGKFVLVVYNIFFFSILFLLTWFWLLEDFLWYCTLETNTNWNADGLNSVLCKLWPTLKSLKKTYVFLSALIGSLLRCKAQI